MSGPRSAQARPPLGLGAATVVFFAAGYPLGSIATQAASGALILVARFIVAALVLTAIITVMKAAWPRGKDAWHAVVAGFFGQGFQFVGCYTAFEAGVSPVLVALIIAMNPVLTLVLATRMVGEPLSGQRLLAVALSVVAVLAALSGRMDTIGHIGVAVGFVFLGLFGISFGSLYQQRFVHSGHPMAINAVGLLGALVPTTVMLVFSDRQIHDLHGFIVSTGALIIVNAILGISLLLAFIRRVGASSAALLFGVIPSVAAVQTWLLLGERPDLGVAIGLVLGAIACFIGARAAQQPRRRHLAPAHVVTAD